MKTYEKVAEYIPLDSLSGGTRESLSKPSWSMKLLELHPM